MGQNEGSVIPVSLRLPLRSGLWCAHPRSLMSTISNRYFRITNIRTVDLDIMISCVSDIQWITGRSLDYKVSVHRSSSLTAPEVLCCRPIRRDHTPDVCPGLYAGIFADVRHPRSDGSHTANVHT